MCARSLFEALCVREGKLYLPDRFLQLAEINEIIPAQLNPMRR